MVVFGQIFFLLSVLVSLMKKKERKKEEKRNEKWAIFQVSGSGMYNCFDE